MRKATLLLILLLVSPAVFAQGGAPADWRGWGLRAGVADDPDQVVVGVHLDLGELFADNLRVVPNAELGVGDDHTILSVTAPLHYTFDIGESFAPYAGGGVTLAVVDRDDTPGRRGDTEIEAAIKGIVGMVWPLRSGRAFNVELNVLAGGDDLYDLELLAGWTF